MPRVPNYRAPAKAPNTKTYWVEEANCNSLDPELFEPTFKGRRENNIKRTEARFEQALEACSDCPVFHLCYQKASPDDFFYTFRAGVVPTQYVNYVERGRVEHRSGQASQEAQKCAKGHNNWKVW